VNVGATVGDGARVGLGTAVGLGAAVLVGAAVGIAATVGDEPTVAVGSTVGVWLARKAEAEIVGVGGAAEPQACTSRAVAGRARPQPTINWRRESEMGKGTSAER
jgi:hypothetical protein